MNAVIHARAWTRRLLGELLEIGSGQIDPREEPFSSMLHVGSDNIESQTGRLFGMRPAGELGLISGKFPFDSSTVLYSKIRPYLNKVALPDFAGICSADIYPLKPDPRILDRRFLAYLLRQKDFLDYAEAFSARTSIPKINREALAAYEAPLPPLEEQRRIVKVLDKADAIRRKRQEAIALTEQLLRSTFLEMFGDPVTNPKHWPFESLTHLAMIGSGVMKGRDYTGIETVERPYMRVANVQDGYLALDDIKTIELPVSEVEKYTLRHGDILLTEGGDPDKLGRGAVWREQVSSCVHQNHIFRVHPDRTRLTSEYLCALLGSAHGKRYFLKAAKQTTGIATINRTQLSEFPVLLPPLKLQQQYSEFVAAHERLTQRYQHLADEQNTLFNSLVQRAFSGQL